MSKLQTEDLKYIRDTNNHALLNVDKNALRKHREQRLFNKQKNDEIIKLRDEINNLRDRNQQLEIMINKIVKELNIDGR